MVDQTVTVGLARKGDDVVAGLEIHVEGLSC